MSLTSISYASRTNVKKGVAALVLTACMCLAAFAEPPVGAQQAAPVQTQQTQTPQQQSQPRNLQKIYPVDSDVYEAITALYISQGLALPSTTGPWSADELLKMLDRIDPAKLPADAVSTYQFAATELARPTKTVSFGLDATLEGYYHTNTTDFTDESDWVVGANERKPLLNLSLETALGKSFYGYSSIPVMNNIYNAWDAAKGATSSLFGQYPFTSNIPMIPPAGMEDIDFNGPYRAFGAFGGDGWSAEIGREQLSWGPGESGNFVIGDQLLYQNIGRFTAYTKNYKYTFLTSFFPYPGNYYPLVDGAGNSTGKGRSQNDPVSGMKMFMAHRLEFNLFKNKVGFVLTEGIMYQSADGSVDLRVLNPAAIFHNYYIRANSNSILSLELNYSPIDFVNLYGQFVMDEFSAPGEPAPGTPGSLPNAYGYMLGAKGRYPFKEGTFYGSVEWALTDPYLYLRDSGNGGTSPQPFGDPGLNFVVATRLFSNYFGIAYDEDFLGYQYGGDAIVYNGSLGYKRFGKWSVEGDFFYMIHGTHDKWTLWTTTGTPDLVDTTPTTHHNTGNNGDLSASTTRDAVSKTLVLGLKGAYTIIRNLDAYGELDYIHIQNPGNVSTNAPIHDLQLTMGISYSL